MSWLYSQAVVEDYLLGSCLDGEPSAQLNVMPTAQAFWRNDKMMEVSRLSRFGLTLKLLTADHGAELLTSFLAAFPVRTSASPAAVTDSTASAQGSGNTSTGLLATYDRNSHSLKTAQCSLFEDSTEFFATLPRSGSMRSGCVYLRPSLAPTICETESGFSPETWPAPTVHGNYNRKGSSKNSGDGLATAVKKWPTPTASLASKGGRITPRKGREGGTLIEAISKRMYPTPTATATDCKGAPTQEKIKERQEASNRGVRLAEEIARSGAVGQLNPNWEEWLMGWPIGQTALEPLETDKYHEWLQQHSWSLIPDSIDEL